MNSELTRDRIAQFANDPMMCVSDEVREIARIALRSFGNSEQLIKQLSNNQDSDGNASGNEIKQPASNGIIGWLRSDYNSDDKRDPNPPLFMLGGNDPSEVWGVKYIPLAGNSPVTPDGWIPVSERMPEEIGRYWCYVEEQNCLGKSHYQWNCSWNGERWWVESDNGGRVTHWMELPAAPKQEVK